jgi:creatinine amidohydrolase
LQFSPEVHLLPNELSGGSGYLEYMHVKPAELTAYVRETPIAYVPFGALEWHGEHMVFGVDSIKASHLCRKAAEITGGVLFPCVNWGAFDALKFPFTLHFRKSHLVKNTQAILEQLYRMGFRVIVMLTGHYPTGQMKNVRVAAQRFTRRHRDGFALGVPEHALATDIGYDGDHAAEWETSIMMAIDPGFVNLERVEAGLTFSERYVRQGIIGRDPGKYASAEKGAKAINHIVQRLAASVQEVLSSQTAEPFERIYREFQQAQKRRYTLQHPLRFTALFKSMGIESFRELWRYMKWKHLRRGKRNPHYTSS